MFIPNRITTRAALCSAINTLVREIAEAEGRFRTNTEQRVQIHNGLSPMTMASAELITSSRNDQLVVINTVLASEICRRWRRYLKLLHLFGHMDLHPILWLEVLQIARPNEFSE